MLTSRSMELPKPLFKLIDFEKLLLVFESDESAIEDDGEDEENDNDGNENGRHEAGCKDRHVMKTHP